MPALPPRPAAEHLRKEAKRLAKVTLVPLARAQRRLADEYGFRSWGAMMRNVAERRGEAPKPSTLIAAARAGDVDAVRRLLADGANPRTGDGRETPLHVVARRGPLELVETLIAGGALEWQPNAAGRTPLDVARRGRARDRTAIIELLDRSSISDRSFRAAVAAIHAGDAAELARLLDAEPRLLRERIVGPDVYRQAPRQGYFLDPKLFWFIADNPTLVEKIPPNITDIARVMIDRGVDERDLDYTLELVMTSSVAREQGHQRAIMRVLLDAGARATRDAVIITAAHREHDALRMLLDAGHPMTTAIAATLGFDDALHDLLAETDRDDIQVAFGLAVINGRPTAAKLALDAGADVNAFLPVHAHSTALHQAALDDNVVVIDMLLSRGAHTDTRDTLWDGTPLDWAIHGGRAAAQAALERMR